jgi:hypothetical protein
MRKPRPRKIAGTPASPAAILARARRTPPPALAQEVQSEQFGGVSESYLTALRGVLDGLADRLVAQSRANQGGIAAIVVELRPGGPVHYVSRPRWRAVARDIRVALGPRQ